MLPTYSMPKLKDLSQGSRITFVREFRLMSLNDVSDKLGLKGKDKGKTMTRYEKEKISPKDDRLLEITEILKVSTNSIKEYKFEKSIDLIYHFMWLEELLPNYRIDLCDVPNINHKDSILFKKCLEEWNIMRAKRAKREISYETYIEWKLNYEIEND